VHVTRGARGADDGPDAGVGTAIVSYIEPHAGAARDFNRWYERDHFPAAVLAGPGAYSGARFVATRACKVVRADASLFGDPRVGSYLSIAWVLPGAQDAWDAWIPGQMDTLVGADRMFPARDHLHTAVYDLAWSKSVGGAPPVSRALDVGFRGVIAIAAFGDDDDLEAWAAAFVGPEVPVVAGLHRRRLLVSALGEPAAHRLVLCFVAGDPQEVWVRAIAPAVAARTDVGFAGPFLATVPGTDTYVDDL